VTDAAAPVRRHVEHALADGRLGHALLFSGGRGTGKRATALWLAQKLLCGAEAAPCGKCGSCLRAARESHPDVSRVRPEAEDAAASAERKAQGRTPRQIISVEQVRRMEAQAAMAPFEGRARIFILDPADRMEAEGMNALLKLVEEPPARTYLILLAVREEALLPTIRSRAQVFRFRGLPIEETAAALASRHGLKPSETLWMAALLGEEAAGGETLSPDRLREERQTCLQILESLRGPGAALRVIEGAEAMSRDAAAEEARQHREFMRLRLELMATLMRDAMLLRFDPEGTERALHPDESARLRECAAAFPPEALLEASGMVEETLRAVDRNVDRRLAAEHLLFGLRRKMEKAG
jgi:DNA polymerase-3 subunit delta'